MNERQLADKQRTSSTRTLPTEFWRRELAMSASFFATAPQSTREAEAYDHASHGCPFVDSGVECPVCDPLEEAFI